MPLGVAGRFGDVYLLFEAVLQFMGCRLALTQVVFNFRPNESRGLEACKAQTYYDPGNVHR